jgi:hypothetical protein
MIHYTNNLPFQGGRYPHKLFMRLTKEDGDLSVVVGTNSMK